MLTRVRRGGDIAPGTDRGSTHHELLQAIETVRQRLAELEERLRTTPPQRERADAAFPREVQEAAGSTRQ
jgi:hypothetical protein